MLFLPMLQCNFIYFFNSSASAGTDQVLITSILFNQWALLGGKKKHMIDMFFRVKRNNMIQKKKSSKVTIIL